MNKIISIMVLGIFLLATIVSAGDAVTDFNLKSTKGKTVYLSDYLGQKVILINFWATWCVPCQQELPHLQKIWEKYQDQDLIVLGVATDGPSSSAKVKPHAKKLGLSFPVLLDTNTDVISVYNSRQVMPYTVIIGKDKTIKSTHEGYAAGDEVKMEKKLAELLGLEAQ